MPVYEYKVVPAPEKGLKGKGIKGAAGRFANALETLMNQLGQDGWDYVRADTLPSEERSGLTGTTTVYQNMLVFRRVQEVAEAPADIAAPQPVRQIAPPEPVAAAPEAPAAAPPAPPRSTDSAAAAAAAAALTAYRESAPHPPRLGPATGRGHSAD